MTREEAIHRLKNTAWLGTNKDREETEQAVDMAIEALSADAVSLVGTMKYLTKPHNYCEVVRCKDCRYAMVRTKEEMNKPIKPQPILCEWFCIGVENNDYCSHGERKEP